MTVAVTPFVLPAQPLLSTDVSAFALLALCVLYTALWQRDREPGMSWLAAAFGAFGLFWSTTRWHLPVSVYVTNPHWNAVVVLGLAFLQVGLVLYLGIHPSPVDEPLWGAIARANEGLRQVCRESGGLAEFVDYNHLLVDAAGRPRPELFRPDGLHFSVGFYRTLGAFLRPMLKSALGPLRPGPGRGIMKS